MIDDSRLARHILRRVLIKNGYKVIDACGGNEGIKLACDKIPDLVLCDIEMPSMDGYDVCRSLKSCNFTADIPFIFLSCKSAGLDIDKAFDVGANDFLSKPVNDNELLSRIKLTLAQRQNKKTREKILVVDDSVLVRNLIKQGLAQQGFEVITGLDGKNGLELAQLHHPDLIVTDFDMPVMNGREMTRALKKRHDLSHIPVMMLTASDSDIDRAKGEHAGVSTFLSKPFTPDKLVVIVEKLIAEQKMYRELEALEHYVSKPAILAAKSHAAAQYKMDNMRADKVFSTILFADIVGFTALAEKNPPEELLKVLNAYLDLMSSILMRNNATIDKFIGDAVMALFPENNGASRKENAFNAVKSGMEMIAALKTFNKSKRSCPDDEICMRVGISSGEVIMGDIGSANYRRDYTVIGRNVNFAAKLETHAHVNTVFISDDCLNLNKDKIELKDSVHFKLKEDDDLKHVAHHVAHIKR